LFQYVLVTMVSVGLLASSFVAAYSLVPKSESRFFGNVYLSCLSPNIRGSLRGASQGDIDFQAAHSIFLPKVGFLLGGEYTYASVID